MVNVAATSVGSLAINFIEHNQVISRPVRKLLGIGNATDNDRCLRSDHNAVRRRRHSRVRLPRVRAVHKLLQVGESVVVGIARGAVVREARTTRAQAGAGAIIERVESVAGFPSVIKSIAIRVARTCVGLTE